MLLKLQRNQPDGESLTGTLYVNGSFYCRTIERTSRAVPALWYHVAVTMSPHFHRLLPIVEAVPGRSGIRFHRGTRPEHSQGCILVPPDKERPLTELILKAQQSHEEIRLDISIFRPDYPYYNEPCPADECAPHSR